MLAPHCRDIYRDYKGIKTINEIAIPFSYGASFRKEKSMTPVSHGLFYIQNCYDHISLSL